MALASLCVSYLLSLNPSLAVNSSLFLFQFSSVILRFPSLVVNASLLLFQFSAVILRFLSFSQSLSFTIFPSLCLSYCLLFVLLCRSSSTYSSIMSFLFVIVQHHSIYHTMT